MSLAGKLGLPTPHLGVCFPYDSEWQMIC